MKKVILKIFFLIVLITFTSCRKCEIHLVPEYVFKEKASLDCEIFYGVTKSDKNKVLVRVVNSSKKSIDSINVFLINVKTNDTLDYKKRIDGAYLFTYSRNEILDSLLINIKFLNEGIVIDDFSYRKFRIVKECRYVSYFH